MKKSNLLVLCCHGVYDNGDFYADRPIEKDIYLKHIEQAFMLLQKNKYDVLIISGGYTKPQVEKSEARGYLDWAKEEKRLGLYWQKMDVILEECARTSAENYLYSICRFYQYYGNFPLKVGSITLGWKKSWHEKVIGPALSKEIAVELIEGEWEKLKEINPSFGLIKDNNGDLAKACEQVLKNNSGEKLDPFEAKKNIEDRDIWKKGHPYQNINNDFKEFFDKLKEHVDFMRSGDHSENDIQENITKLAKHYPWCK